MKENWEIRCKVLQNHTRFLPTKERTKPGYWLDRIFIKSATSPERAADVILEQNKKRYGGLKIISIRKIKLLHDTIDIDYFEKEGEQSYDLDQWEILDLSKEAAVGR